MLTEKPLGICPACGQTVFNGENEPIWVCPTNIDKSNPYYQAPIVEITAEQQEEQGLVSQCGSDFGTCCHEDLPLHRKCYESEDY